MHLMDVRIDHFEALNNVVLENLSPRVTVFWGPTIRKIHVCQISPRLLYGYRQNTPWAQSDLNSASGSVRVQTEHGTRTLRRMRLPGAAETFTVTDDFDRLACSGPANGMPAWVTEDVFREIFSVGHEEVERFDLLTRLCSESGFCRNENDAELCQAEAALIQAIRDRDGNGIRVNR